MQHPPSPVAHSLTTHSHAYIARPTECHLQPSLFPPSTSPQLFRLLQEPHLISFFVSLCYLFVFDFPVTVTSISIFFFREPKVNIPASPAFLLFSRIFLPSSAYAKCLWCQHHAVSLIFFTTSYPLRSDLIPETPNRCFTSKNWVFSFIPIWITISFLFFLVFFLSYSIFFYVSSFYILANASLLHQQMVCVMFSNCSYHLIISYCSTLSYSPFLFSDTLLVNLFSENNST